MTVYINESLNYSREHDIQKCIYSFLAIVMLPMNVALVYSPHPRHDVEAMGVIGLVLGLSSMLVSTFCVGMIGTLPTRSRIACQLYMSIQFM